jgi:MoxR-like ATPase
VTDERPPDWRIYRGTGEPHDDIGRLPSPPPWRAFGGEPLPPLPLAEDATSARRLGATERAGSYRADALVVEMVNAALYLRRPLLITGKPGTGKSTLAYSVGYELRLGSVLYWPINSRSMLTDGLYQYDAVGRLQEAALHQGQARRSTSQQPPDIGRFIRLGPLGTALLPRERPRVLLIDELDKSDIDLPNDLLSVFEEGGFVISELARLPADQAAVEVFTTSDRDDRALIKQGSVTCREFPFVVITSNAEREFPPAFLRRCMRLDIQPPNHFQLAAIITAQLGEEALSASAPIIERFLRRREDGDIATDQLLNAIYLATSGSRAPEQTRERLEQVLLRPLDTAGPP